MKTIRTGMWLILGAVVVLGLSVAPSHAAVIFSDNFDAEHGGVGILNFNGFTNANWTVSDGTVDLIGNGFFDFYPGNGLYIDLDGSTGNAGIMTSKDIFLAPGNYELSFFLGGSTRGDSNSMVVSVPGLMATVFLNVPSSYPFSLSTLPFTVPSGTNAKIVFENQGGDNLGLILDQVSLNSVSAVSEPATIILLGSGLLGLVGYRRRKRMM